MTKRITSRQREQLLQEKAFELRADVILRMTEHMSAEQVRTMIDQQANLEHQLRERIRWQADKRNEEITDFARTRLNIYIDALQWVLDQLQVPRETVKV